MSRGLFAVCFILWCSLADLTTDLVSNACGAEAGKQDRSSISFSDAKKVLTNAIEERAFPGCSFAVGTARRVLWQGGFGHFAYDDAVIDQLDLARNPKPSEKTIYDLASLTKVVGTTSVIMRLVSQEKLNIDDPVARWIPQFADGMDGDRRAKVTLEHLLVHASGLPAWKAFHRDVDTYDGLLKRAVATQLESAPATRYRYSDIGFILLGEIAARAGGAPLTKLEEELIFAPLGMANTTRDPESVPARLVPPTELDPETNSYIHREVHDENSRAANGRTGHAGLFSSAKDLSRFASEYLRAREGASRVFDRALSSEFTARRGLPVGSSRALGWDTPSGRSSGGEHISPNAFGHTGFTGTSIWIDPTRGIYLILLSNRVHPTRDNRKISRVRRDFANAVLTAIDHVREK